MKRKLNIKLKTPKQMKQLHSIPTGEIWIDKTLSKSERNFLITTESEYCRAMKNKTYEDVHKEATDVETNKR
jgi:hypothetical protein